MSNRLLSAPEVDTIIGIIANTLADHFRTSLDDVRPPVLLTVAEGGRRLAAELHHRLPPLGAEFVPDEIQISTFDKGSRTGRVEIVSEPTIPLGDRTVVIVDDIIDSGLTVNVVSGLVQRMGAKDIWASALLVRESQLDRYNAMELKPFSRWAFGCKVPDGIFLYGWGMDDANGNGRHLNEIWYEGEPLQL